MSKTASAKQAHLFSEWKGHEREPVSGDVYRRDSVWIHFDRAEALYAIQVGIHSAQYTYAIVSSGA